MTENRIIDTQDGSNSIESGRFGVSYHSRYGAVQESMHVFIQAGLFPRMLSRDRLDVLELGFGSGLNALLTLREAVRRSFPIAYTTWEAYPIGLEQAGQLNYPDFISDFPEAAAHFQALHRAPWDERIVLSPFFSLHKVNAQFETLRAVEAFDLVYFDPFAPETQPEMWEDELLGRVSDALRPGGALVTYCAKGVVKRRLKALGLEVEALQGPPGKREMTRAVKPS